MKIEYSIVIPVLNEEESIEELFVKIREVFKKIKTGYEVIFVDDGSTDSSLQILKNLEKSNKDVKLFSFRRNMGKPYALMQGFKKAKGEFIVTLDADLQDDPSNIPTMRSKLDEDNFDLVTGWRKNRKDTFFKKITSKIFNKVVSLMFGVKVHDLNSGLRLYRTDAAQQLKLYGGMHRFIPIIMYKMGYKVGEQATIHHERKYGVSKYKSSKVISEIPDIFTIYFLTKYTNRPLHFFGKIGSLVLFAGVLILLYLSILHFIGESIGNRPLLLLGILLVIAGIQTIFTGLLADLLVNMNSKKEDSFPLKYGLEE
ncbi:MAG: glycosyltransferase [Candidatus Levybacteria bacterium CG_4_10_14_0_2_um_filter_36_16]|nr:MAG: glycosyltransferase [Candidatus Levybacteria bacterium CG2_30_37_29]PIR79451.1 MAG: glycosyltransferase [Candidatus Levybacteria bacterium CG10_big_fil_rev_8_21_14_0_10_36_30]PIZ97181.1 MAG: glycosyltransferase [Candidatus Levybacteria bacterium CG_4_10_14_0_2_um_filter_36_16]